ncbi:Rid family detoxifying hydrolase [Sutterella sp.]|uniref:Rid family detoxifying hydrolase n=1 Tax=Sutterella sp. TaxID=1981025 RepID=UPI0025DD3956|nr:Rid family detoxifying hydrolase [uncultured Sutterella sp.]
MAHRIISTEEAPAAIGLYSQGALTETTLYCSGQLGIRPETGELEPDVESQTRQAFRNLQAVAHEAGATLADVAKLTIFLKSMDDFAVVNKVMGEFITPPYPARSCVAVAALPKGGLVEIEAIIDRVGIVL